VGDTAIATAAAVTTCTCILARVNNALVERMRINLSGSLNCLAFCVHFQHGDGGCNDPQTSCGATTFGRMTLGRAVRKM